MSGPTGTNRLESLALSERGFLFDPATGQTYSLNQTATFALKSLIGGAKPAALPDMLSARFDVDPVTAGRDAEQFLLQLRDMGLWDDELDAATRANGAEAPAKAGDARKGGAS